MLIKEISKKALIRIKLFVFFLILLIAMSISTFTMADEWTIVPPDQSSVGENVISCDLSLLMNGRLDQSVVVDLINQNYQFTLAEFVFTETREIAQVKFFRTDNNADFNSIGFEYYCFGSWVSIPELNLLDLNYLSTGWHRFRLSEPILTDKIRVKIYGAATTHLDCGLSSLEFWGNNELAREVSFSDNGEVLIFSGWDKKDKSVLIDIDQPLNWIKKAELVYSVYGLETVTEGSFQINTGSKQFLTPPGEKWSWQTNTEEINPVLLIPGENEIKFRLGNRKQNGFKIKDVNLVLYYKNGMVDYLVEVSENTAPDFTGDLLYDNNLDTYWESKWDQVDHGQLTFDLKSLTDLEKIRWYQSFGHVDHLQIDYYAENQWWQLEEFSVEQLQEGWNEHVIDKKFTTDKLRFIIQNPQNKQMLGRISEVEIYGSNAEVNPCPEINLLYPLADGFEDNPFIFIKGFVKNDYETLYINDIELSTDVYDYFSTEQHFQKLKWVNKFIRKIEIKAVDKIGRAGILERIIYRKPLPQVEITSPLNGTWTKDKTILIQGQADHRWYDFYINDILMNDIWDNQKGFHKGGSNGKWNEKFSFSYSLNEGANLVTVRAVSQHGLAASDSVVVYKDSLAPVLYLADNYDGLQLTGIETFIIEGFIEDYSQPKLWINDDSVALESVYFAYPAHLVEGINEFGFKIIDKLENQSFYQIGIVLDNTPPLPFTPVAEPAEWSRETRPIISFETSDLITGINHYELKIDDGEYVNATSPYHLPELSDGVHTIFVKAIDNVGLETVETVQVYVDTTVPNEFRPIANPADWSQNTQPIISFATTDDHSGIDHYELKLNDGEYVITSSPHQLPELTDGIHTVFIKAVDKVGLETVASIEVFVDTTAPNKFLPEADPSEWSQIIQPIISFATTDDHSGLNHFELKIDDGEYDIVTSPYKLPELIDGIHTISIKAVDRVGLETMASVEVFVDTTLPNEFVPEAEPSGWSQITQPMISFSTTDDHSGVSHYEYKIVHGDSSVTFGEKAPTEEELNKILGEGPGGDYLSCTSPLKLLEQPDGIHTIWIKAVDNVGLERYEPTQIYVDTTPTASLTNFVAFPGDKEARLGWQANEEWDLAWYRVYRQPAWSDKEFIDIIGEAEPRYFDREELVNGQEYTYWLTTIDHVGNESEITEKLTIEIGIQEVVIAADTGGKVEFSDVIIDVPIGAIEEDKIFRITAIEEPELFPDSGNTIIGSIKSFNLVDLSTGQIEEEVEFRKPLSTIFKYEDDWLEEGVSELDLNVYYYDVKNAGWIIVEKVSHNPFTNTIIIEMEHFTPYCLQVDENYTPGVSEFMNLGLAPYLNYFKNHQEYVSPSNGALNIHATDFFLSGRKGLDLTLKRTYNSQIALLEKISPKYVKNMYPGFGLGWRLNLPHIEKTGKGQFLYLEGGSGYELDWEKAKEIADGQLYAVNYKDGFFFTARKKSKKIFNLKFKDEKIEEIWEDVDYEVVLKDGTGYYFDGKGRIKRIIDRTNENKIEFEYLTGEIVITDSLNRKIRVKHSNDLITQISSDAYLVEYKYNPNSILEKVIQQGQWETEYNYEEMKVFYGGEVTREDGLVLQRYKSKDIFLIDQIKYPTGGMSNYKHEYRTYKKSEQVLYENITYDLKSIRWLAILVTKQQNMVDGSEANLMSFDYDIEISDIVRTTSIKDQYKATQNYDEGLVVEEEIYDLTQSEIVPDYTIKSTYNDYKLIEAKTYYREGVEVYNESYWYDDWGNRLKEFNSANDVEIYYTYLNTDAKDVIYPNGMKEYTDVAQVDVDEDIHNLLTGRYIANTNPVNGETTHVQSYYQYDEIGNLLLEAQWVDTLNNWVETKYQYDQFGNVVQVVGPGESFTTIDYSNEYQNAYPTKIIKQAADDYGNRIPLRDGLGQEIVSLTIWMGYDFASGQRIWEIDGEGYLTEYAYDYLNRLALIRYPDQDDQIIFEWNKDSQLIPEDYLHRGNNPVKIQYYDDLNNKTVVVNAENLFGSSGSDLPLHELQGKDSDYPAYNMLLKANQYDTNVSYLVTDETISGVIFNKTSYQYDGLGRLKEVNQFLKDEELIVGQNSPFVTEFIYDRWGNVIEEIDAEGRRTLKDYDCYGRVTTYYYPDENGNTTRSESHPTKTVIEYDDWQNSRFVTDALGNKVEEYKDWLGNVIEVRREAVNENQTYLYYALYDQLNNMVKTETPNGVTEYHYDSRNLQIKTVLPEVNVIKPGNIGETIETPEIVTIYDEAGNKVKEISANGTTTLTEEDYETEYTYDALGRLVKVVGAEDSEVLNFYDRKNQLVKILVKVRELSSGEIKDFTDNPNVINGVLYRIKENVYHPRGWNEAEIVKVDEDEFIVYNQFDIIGRIVAVTDPRGVVTADDELVEATWSKTVIRDNEYALSPYFTVRMKYDSLGRKIKDIGLKLTSDEITTSEESRIGYTYDRVGNLKTETLFKVASDGEESVVFTRSYEYDARNWLKDEKLNGVLQVAYKYDHVGNKRYVRDNLNNTVEYRYDGFGRVTEVINPNGSTTLRQYDALDNLIYERDDNWNIIKWEYDNLGRLIRVNEPDITGDARYYYDLDGNLVKKKMSNGYEVEYEFNQIGQLLRESKMVNGEKLIDYYGYYPNGELKYKINPNGVKVEYKYDLRGLNDKVEYFTYTGDYWQVYGNTALFNDIIALDNNWAKKEWSNYAYNRLGLIEEVGTYRIFDGQVQKNSGIRTSYNSLNQITELISEISNTGIWNEVTESYDMVSYSTEYRYDAAGNVVGIKYPGSSIWLEYQYNQDNRLVNIPGFVEDYSGSNHGFSYDKAGRLTDMRYANGVLTHFELDELGRTKDIQVSGHELNETNNIIASSLDFSYQYDGVGNVKSRNENNYYYDRLNRLTKAEIMGLFYDQTYVSTGYIPKDILSNQWIDFNLAEETEVKLDYGASSLGIAFNQVTDDIGRIVLLDVDAVPGINQVDNRITKRTIKILKSEDNWNYELIPEDEWELEKDPGGNLVITFRENVTAKYLKIHSNYDDRNRDGSLVDLAEFKNLLNQMILVYKRQDNVTIEYGYDDVGNREWREIKGGNISRTDYSYYSSGDGTRSNRLMEIKTVHEGRRVTECYAYDYDREGNLINKGNIYELRDKNTRVVIGDNESLEAVGDYAGNIDVEFTKQTGIYVQYWGYEYNLQNRLELVKKNKEEIARFIYDNAGKRIKSEEDGRIVHYVYGLGGKLIYEKEVANGVEEAIGVNFADGVYEEPGFVKKNAVGTKSYIIAFGKTIAEVEGKIGEEGEIYYYHHDNLGSTTALTGADGIVVMQQDYLPFGEDLYKTGIWQPLRDKVTDVGYTGQVKDTSIGLYYYNARYYDPEVGRFTREDEYLGELVNPQSQNLYSYVVNNPLLFVDPSGSTPEWFDNLTAKIKLHTTIYRQYPAAILGEMLLTRTSYAIFDVIENKDYINEIGQNYDIPSEIIASIIIKEQITQSGPDELALLDTAVRGKKHSVGLGAIFPETAITSWADVDGDKFVNYMKENSLGIREFEEEVEWLLYLDKKFNIETIAVVLTYEAKWIYKEKNICDLTIAEWKKVVGKYNADSEDKQKKYSDKVYDYLEPIRELLD